MAAEPAPLDGLDVVGQLLDALTEPAIVIDRDYRILAANPAYRASYGEELPLCKDANEQCWSINRRAHLVDLDR